MKISLIPFLLFFHLILSNAMAHSNQTKPTILILTTGGTIAGTANQPGLVYKAGQTEGNTLIASVPALKDMASIHVDSIAKIGSQDMSDAVMLKLAKRIQLAEQDPAIQGIVITHGTDTMEETAFFLNMVLPHHKPVILTGAMRPPAFESADGASNLINAVRAASDPESWGRPVMIVMNDTIFSARSAQKTNTTSLHTFQAPNNGPIGVVNKDHLNFYHPETKTAQAAYSLPKTTPFPRVDIIYSHVQMDDGLIQDAIKRGAKGIILAGVGDGNSSATALNALKDATNRGIIVVRSSRVGSGFVNRNVEVNDDENHFIASIDLTPQKARILLQILLANHVHDLKSIQNAFSYSE